MRRNWYVGLFLLLTIMLMGMSRVSAEPPAKEAPAAILVQCAADLEQRLQLSSKEIGLESATPVVWPDTALGMPEPGKLYAQVLTPGWRVILKARNTQYLYTTSGTTIKYGGPVALWSASLFHVVPIHNEPNLNGDLYQCALLGSNCTHIATGVSDYYPQANGFVLFTRRTSRSGHDLLLVKVDGKNKAVPLHSAFAFGAAALNEAGTAWAAYTRAWVGEGWTVMVGQPGKPDMQTFPLPDGLRPGKIAWVGDHLVILANKGEGTACYEIVPAAEKPEWKTAATFTFPGAYDYMLNKSETLEIEQATVNGKPAVEVARVWFTGNRKVMATLPGLTLRGQSLLGRFAVVWGDRDGKSAVYAVDIATGEVTTGPTGLQNIVPAEIPPISSPLTR